MSCVRLAIVSFIWRVCSASFALVVTGPEACLFTATPLWSGGSDFDRVLGTKV